jgi:hypothetical protein
MVAMSLVLGYLDPATIAVSITTPAVTGTARTMSSLPSTISSPARREVIGDREVPVEMTSPGNTQLTAQGSRPLRTAELECRPTGPSFLPLHRL